MAVKASMFRGCERVGYAVRTRWSPGVKHKKAHTFPGDRERPRRKRNKGDVHVQPWGRHRSVNDVIPIL